jgi:drug/metabolite transporter (DMT)-like permease
MVGAHATPGPVGLPGATGPIGLMPSRRAYLLLAVVLVFWAGNYPLGKLALQDLGPLTLTGARTLLAAPLLFLAARLTAPLPRALGRADHVAFLVLGLSGLVANTTVWYLGLKHTTALNAGIVGASSPIFVGVAASLLLGDRLAPRNWVGIGLSVVAVLVTVAKGSPAVLLGFAVNRGDLLILASQLAWVVYALYSRATASTLPPVWIMAGANVVGGIVLVPLALLLEHPWEDWRAWAAWLVVVYGAVPITLGHLWFYQVIRTLGAGPTVAFLNLMPFAVLALSWALLGEMVHAYHVVGAALVVAGVYLATRPT